jgi:ATP-binding cassette subfamily B protein
MRVGGCGHVRDTLCLWCPDVSEDQIWSACADAQLIDMITALPDGYDTDIGQRGVKLSGGQKQRLSIARVFLKDPSILIFDEATSALDGMTEDAVMQAVQDLLWPVMYSFLLMLWSAK